MEEVSWEQFVERGSSAPGQSLPTICSQTLLRTRHCGVASARSHLVSFFISLSLTVLLVGASGKPRASQSPRPFKKLSESWHMLFNHGLKWILITPVTERAGKHRSANLSRECFSGKNENAQLKIKLVFHPSSCHYKNVAYIVDQWQTNRFVIPDPLQLCFYITHITASLHLFLLLGSSMTSVAWSINIQMHTQFREENDLDMTLAKSTICAGNKMIFYYFFLFCFGSVKI